MSILVTGGAGYIGSHTAKALKKDNLKPIVLDNLVYGHKHIVEDILKIPLVFGQVGDKKLLEKLLSSNHELTKDDPIKGIIHFAAYTYVGESCLDPIKYYKNNFIESFNLFETVLNQNRISGSNIPIVFSSTCATYGLPNAIPIKEISEQNPINPYGKSKLFIEQVLKDFANAYGLSSMIFRYFNAAGADPNGTLGEDHNPETHLIPLVIKGLLEENGLINIFGNDYSTKDGTCIRDYIHVCDLADAHVLGLKKLLKLKKQKKSYPYIYNLGNGKGYSIMDVIKAAENIVGKQLNIKFTKRREGDLPILVASAEKAKNELGWIPKYPDLEEIVQHAYNWHLKNDKKFNL